MIFSSWRSKANARDIRLGIVAAKRHQLVDFDENDWEEGQIAYEINGYIMHYTTPSLTKRAYYQYNQRHKRDHYRKFYNLFDGFTRLPVGTAYL